MKSKKNKRREIVDILNDVQKIYEENDASLSSSHFETISQLFSEKASIEKRNKKENRIVGIVLLSLLLFLFSMFYILMNENETIADDNYNKELLIKKLINENDALTQQNNTLYLFIQSKEDSIKQKKDSLTISTRNGRILTYYDLKHIIDSLQEETLKKDIEILTTKGKLSAVEKMYGITVDENKDSYLFIAAKVDSALMLYPYFKDRLKYDTISNSWTISIIK